MSAAELLVALYFAELNIDPARPRDENRDRFILSKGHSSIGLYAALALRGYLPIEELATFDAIDSRLQGHPDMSVLPGLDMSTGSLGQGLSARPRHGPRRPSEGAGFSHLGDDRRRRLSGGADLGGGLCRGALWPRQSHRHPRLERPPAIRLGH